MPYSQFFQQKLLACYFGGTAYAAPGTLYVGLTAQVVSGATQANILSGEPTATGGYARIAVANNTSNWAAVAYAAPTAQQWTITSQSFPVSTGSGWSTGNTQLIQAFIADAATLGGGNVLCYGALTASQIVNAAGITLTFAANTLIVSLT